MPATSSDRQGYALQTIFSFFLGLMVVALIGVGVNTFYQSPVDKYQKEQISLSRQMDARNIKNAKWAIFSGNSFARFAVILFALVVALGLGYLKFVRGRALSAPRPPQRLSAARDSRTLHSAAWSGHARSACGR